MFNEKFLFGFLNLGDDMLFPDYANYKIISSGSSYTFLEDSLCIFKKNIYLDEIRLNSSPIGAHSYTTGINFPFLVKRGDILTKTSELEWEMVIYPLTRKGGGGN